MNCRTCKMTAVLARLEDLLRKETICYARAQQTLLCAVQHAGVRTTVFKCSIVQEEVDAGVTIECARVRGCDATFRRIVQCITEGMTRAPLTPCTDARDDARHDGAIGMQVTFAMLNHPCTAWNGAASFARLLSMPGFAAESVETDALHIWSRLIQNTILQPTNLDVAAQGALCLLLGLQHGCTHHALYVPFILRLVLPHIQTCLEHNDVPVMQTDDADDAEVRALRIDAVLYLYKQLVTCIDIVAFLLDDAFVLENECGIH